jgi:S1-C subfamily serine protease
MARAVPPLLLGLGLAAAACAPVAPPAPGASAPDKPATAVEVPRAPADARQIAVTKLLSKIGRGTRIGGVGAAPGCVPTTAITWQRTLDEDVLGQEVRVVREELKRAGYRVAGHSGVLFEDPSLEPPDLLLAGAIKRVAYSTCRVAQGIESDGSVEIEWQVYEPRTRSVLLTSTTRGAAKMPPGGSSAYLEAYAVAARELLARPEFAAVVARLPTAGAAPEYPPLALALVTLPPTERTPEVLEHDQRAVVRILRGTGHGSGVVVSAAGWILTAAHAVGGPGASVDVELAGGQRLTGSVLRANAVADVALVQLPRGDYPAAPVGVSAELKVGEPVFAIGTPLAERFSRSVTKGVVSALRPSDGRTIIQSDVVVHAGSSGGPLLDRHGRVVGLAISGAVIGGSIGVGLNIFLGIDDAWRALQVEPQISTREPGALLQR